MAEFTIIEALAMLAGWPLFITTFIILILITKFTPAMTYLKAWWGKKSIYETTYRDGTAELYIGENETGGTAETPDGIVSQTEGSQVLHKKGKVNVYHLFGEYAPTIERTYGPIIQELKEAGFKINTFKDIQRIVLLAQNEELQAAYIDSFKESKEKQAIAKEYIEKIKSHKIEIKPYKTYKIHELASMFPFNQTPNYIRAKVVNAETRARKRAGNKEIALKFMIVGAITFFIIVIAAIMLFKFIKDPACPYSMSDLGTLCNAGRTGLETASTIAQNMTM
jgi:hypothetical protein